VALPSSEGQGADEVLVLHDPDGTTSSARNDLARAATSDWLCFLDGDDQLAPGYLSAMRQKMRQTIRRPGEFLFVPRVQYVGDGGTEAPKFWPVTDYWNGNWMVIGTLVRREFFYEIGMFQDYGDPPGSNAYVDWAMWARCQMGGAVPVKVRGAIYIAHKHRDSQQRAASHRQRLAWVQEIQRDLFPERFPELL
jgi:hypothetical protein